MVYKKGLASRYASSGYPGASTAKKASKALYLVSKMAKSLNVEKKYYDTVIQANISGGISTANSTQLNSITIGTDEYDRVGGQVKAVTSYLKSLLYFNAAGSASQTVRMLLIVDKEGGTSLSPATFLEAVSSNSQACVSPMKWDDAMRFSVLKDKTYTLSADRPLIIVKWFIDLAKRYRKAQGMHIRYASGSTTPNTNAYYVCLITDQTSNTPISEVYHRLRYVDN